MGSKFKNVCLASMLAVSFILTTKIAEAQKATVIKFDGLQKIR